MDQEHESERAPELHADPDPETGATAAPPALAPNPKADPELFAQIWSKLTAVDPKNVGKPMEVVKCRYFSWEFDGSLGAPGFFVDANGDYVDIRVQMKTLTSAEELEALSELVPDGIMSAPSMLAKRMLYRIGSVQLTADQRNVVWEALGVEGRRVAILASQEIGGPVSQGAMGKYRSTFTVE